MHDSADAYVSIFSVLFIAMITATWRLGSLVSSLRSDVKSLERMQSDVIAKELTGLKKATTEHRTLIETISTRLAVIEDRSFRRRAEDSEHDHD